MWYFLLALLFGNPSNNKTNNDQTVYKIQAPDNGSDHGGTTRPVRPGK